MSGTLAPPRGDWADELAGNVRSFFRTVPGTILGQVKTWRRNRAQESLEAFLAKVIETANGHQTKGTPKGSPVYFALCEKADTRIDAFCRKWNVDRSVIEAEAPNLKELQTLCIPDKETPVAIKLLAGLLGGALCLVLVGAASGLIHAGHNLIMHLIAR